MQGQSLEEGRYVGVSKNWCHCPCAPWHVDLKQQTHQSGEPIWHAFTQVCKEDQCARQCHMLLLSPERRRQSLGSAGNHFRCKCKTLQELVTHTQQGVTQGHWKLVFHCKYNSILHHCSSCLTLKISQPWNLCQRSFKVIESGTTRKIAYDFLLVFHINYGPNNASFLHYPTLQKNESRHWRA